MLVDDNRMSVYKEHFKHHRGNVCRHFAHGSWFCWVSSLAQGEGEELPPGSGIIVKFSQHHTCNSTCIHLLHAPHHHAHVTERQKQQGCVTMKIKERPVCAKATLNIISLGIGTNYLVPLCLVLFCFVYFCHLNLKLNWSQKQADFSPRLDHHSHSGRFQCVRNGLSNLFS